MATNHANEIMYRDNLSVCVCVDVYLCVTQCGSPLEFIIPL